MKVYLVFYWCGSFYDYSESKIGIFSTLEKAREIKENYIIEHEVNILDGEGVSIYEFELDKYISGEDYKLEVE